jgi:hypothetical protein
MPQQLLHTPKVETGSDKVDGKAMPEPMGMDVDINHPAYFLTMFQTCRLRG